MSDDLATAQSEVRRRVLDSRNLVRAAASGVQRGRTTSCSKVELRPVDLKGRLHLQIVRHIDDQAHTENVPYGDAAAASRLDALLTEGFARWSVTSTNEVYTYRVSKAGKVLVAVHRPVDKEKSLRHDRAKSRLLDTRAPFLQLVGITDADGVVKPSRADKYRQVEEFVRQLDLAVRGRLERYSMDRDVLQVVDLGCGNAYLTFAAFHHLAEDLDLPVAMIGVDAKQQARRRNERIAHELGWSSSLQFRADTIAAVTVPDPVAITLALHACDTATDDALARAVQWDSELILAAPCCHHELQRQMQHHAPPAPYGIVTKSGILRQRWADVLTDALRAELLRAMGYRVDVIEFVDSRHTPRNSLIRAERTSSVRTKEKSGDYADLVAQWQVKPVLEVLFEGM